MKNNYMLIGLGTLKNKGCEAILDVTASQIKKACKQNKVIVATDDLYYDKNYHLDKVDKYVSHCIQHLPEGLSKEEQELIFIAENSPFDYKNYEKVYQKKVLEEIPNVDVVMSIGGDNYCYGASEWLYTIDYYTKENNKKLVLWGASIQEENLDDEFLRDLKRFDLLVFRETLSYNLAKKYIDEEKLLLIPDPAFALGKEKVDINIPENTVAINVSPIIEKSNKTSFETINNFIDYLLKNSELNILLLPHVFTDICNDMDTLRKIKEKYNCNERVILLDNKCEYNAKELKYIISKCRFVVAARTHASIAAYSLCIPTLVLGYSVKSKGIANDLFGTYENYVIPIEELNLEYLIECFNYIRNNEVNIKNILNSKIPKYKEEASKIFYTVSKRIEKVKTNEIYSYKNREVYACKNKSNSIRLDSTPGGVFYELAKRAVEKNGTVFGAAYIEGEVKHIGINKIEDIKALQGAKYVESNMHNVLPTIKKSLDNSDFVLFSGTPCQVAALYKYLDKDYLNLFTVSLICHGVPSKSIYNEYIKSVEEEYNDKLNYVKFRNKAKGIKGTNIKYVFKKSSTIKEPNDDYYFKSFINNLTLRESCYDCKFKLYKNSKSDIILGDFWGIDKVCPQFNDGFGVSAVIVNSDNGKKYFEKIKDNFIIEKTTIDDVIKGNPLLVESAPLTLERYNFLNNRNKMGTLSAMKYSLRKIENIRLQKHNEALINENVNLKEKLSLAENVLASKRFKLIDRFGNIYNRFKYFLKGR